AFYQFSEYSQLYRVLGMVAIVIVALTIMLTTALGHHSWVFAQEARQEVRKSSLADTSGNYANDSHGICHGYYRWFYYMAFGYVFILGDNISDSLIKEV
ncbi:[weak similarity to] preprotein translocase, SecE subunit, partial [methanotrophic bacterial endosymbiont of Bathymodiolus sp.]